MGQAQRPCLGLDNDKRVRLEWARGVFGHECDQAHDFVACILQKLAWDTLPRRCQGSGIPSVARAYVSVQRAIATVAEVPKASQCSGPESATKVQEASGSHREPAVRPQASHCEYYAPDAAELVTMLLESSSCNRCNTKVQSLPPVKETATFEVDAAMSNSMQNPGKLQAKYSQMQ